MCHALHVLFFLCLTDRGNQNREVAQQWLRKLTDQWELQRFLQDCHEVLCGFLVLCVRVFHLLKVQHAHSSNQSCSHQVVYPTKLYQKSMHNEANCINAQRQGILYAAPILLHSGIMCEDKAPVDYIAVQLVRDLSKTPTPQGSHASGQEILQLFAVYCDTF